MVNKDTGDLACWKLFRFLGIEWQLNGFVKDVHLLLRISKKLNKI